MPIKHYGFIILAPQYSPETTSTIIDNQVFKSQIIGVSDISQAIQVAKDMVASGIEVIELCGGFGEANAKQLIDSVNTTVPIGFVTFSTSEQTKLEQFLVKNDEGVGNEG